MLNKIKGKLRLKMLQGSTVHCPCCEGNFIAFLPGGVLTKRPHASCPQCGSLERHRLLWHFLVHETNIFKHPQNLLHIAPERLFFKKFQAIPSLKYVPCAKFGEGFTDEYPAGTLDRDLTALEDPDHTYDSILCSHVLEHIPDDATAMRELYRVLKPGGWAILQVPLNSSLDKTYEDFSITDPKKREEAFGQYDHVRVYGNDYSERLSDAGFTVNRIPYTKNFSEQDIFRYGFRKEDIFYCVKPK